MSVVAVRRILRELTAVLVYYRDHPDEFLREMIAPKVNRAVPLILRQAHRGSKGWRRHIRRQKAGARR